MKIFNSFKNFMKVKKEDVINLIIKNSKQEDLDKLKQSILEQEIVLNTKKIFICTDCERRNKLRKNKIDLESPQCPIYNDNRCCGSCYQQSTCQYFVNCNCYGITKGIAGGTDNYYLNEELHKNGKLTPNGNYDWDYHHYQEVLQTGEKYVQFNICNDLKKKRLIENLETISEKDEKVLSEINNRLEKYNYDKLIMGTLYPTILEILGYDEKNHLFLVSNKAWGGNTEMYIESYYLNFFCKRDTI